MSLNRLFDLTAQLREPSVLPLVTKQASAHRKRFQAALDQQAPRLRITPPPPPLGQPQRPANGSTSASSNGGTANVAE
ncbi:MAG: hypothetical protein R3B68_01815 [Phycisphaerales bacterium]